MFCPAKSEACAAAAALAILFFAYALPTESMGVISLSGNSSGTIGLFGSPTSSLTTAPGQTGASITLMSDVPASPAADFTGTVNFGNLSGGDGTPSVASFALRERGNVACHIAASVSSYTATNISYNGGSGSTPLSGASGSELKFVTLGNGNVTAGSAGNAGVHSYGSKFQGGSTLDQLNNGTIGSVSATSDEFDSFSSAPSNSGNLTSTNNYVQDMVTFSIPTGFTWAPTNNSGTGTFSIAIEFEVFEGP